MTWATIPGSRAAPGDARARPLSRALGVELRGLDPRGACGATWQLIQSLFLRHQVVVFRGLNLTADELVEIGSRFGEPMVYPFLAGVDGSPQVVRIVKERHETMNFGGGWHSDTAYLSLPPRATLLYACEVPPDGGGDTLFANQYLAYERLSPGMRSLLERLRCVNAADVRDGGSSSMKVVNADRAAALRAVHPAVRVHPETNRPALYVGRFHCVQFEHMTPEESRPLIDWVAEHAVRPELTCRLRWEPGSLAVWDNRCTQHLAVNDYDGERRVMQRVVVGPERPVPSRANPHP